MRDDGLLNTGMSSAVERKQQQRAAEQKRQREAQRSKLTPAADIILQWIDEELKEANNISYMIMHVDSEKNVRAQLLARQMHIDYLTKLKNRAKATLRMTEDPDKDAPQAWKDAAK